MRTENFPGSVLAALLLLAVALSATPVGVSGGNLVAATDGSQLTGLNASNLSTGTVAAARLPGAMYSITGGTSAAIGAGLTRYLSGVNGATLTTSFAVGIVGSAGYLQNFSCLTNTSAGNLVATVQYYNGVAWFDSGLTLTATSTAGPVDNLNRQAVSANYAVGFKTVASAGYSGNYVTCTVQVGP